jgi:hypothetical protein
MQKKSKDKEEELEKSQQTELVILREEVAKLREAMKMVELRPPLDILKNSITIKFDGRGNVQTFANKFRTLMERNAWDNSEAWVQLALMLEDKAADYLMLWSQSNDRNVDQFMAALAKRFAGKYDSEFYMDQLLNLKQGTCSVAEFEQEIMDLALKVYLEKKPDQKLLFSIATRGLKQEIRMV